MENYQAQSFKDVFDSLLGQEIWKYLTSEDAKIRMLLTSDLGHPAAEGIGDKLVEYTGVDLKSKDRVKQAIGHMIKYIMEQYGYELVQRSVKCRKKTEVFVYASRYEKK